MSIGSLIAFLTYLTQILMAVMMATFMAVLVPRATVCAERIGEVFDTEPSVRIAPSPIRDLAPIAALEFRAVSFRYVGDDARFATRPWLHSPPFDDVRPGEQLDDARFPVVSIG